MEEKINCFMKKKVQTVKMALRVQKNDREDSTGFDNMEAAAHLTEKFQWSGEDGGQIGMH